MDEKGKLIDLLIKEKGGTREQYENLLNSIAYHESAGTMDSTLHQYGGGPGRGKYQFEVGKNQGAITAARRLKQYYEKEKVSVPKWLKDSTKENSLDVTILTPEQQDILFLGNMRMHPKANLANVIEGKESIPEFWAKYHWAGNNSDKEVRLKSFNHSFEKYKEINPQEITNKIQEDNIKRTVFQNEVQQIKDNPIQERQQSIQQRDAIPQQKQQIQQQPEQNFGIKDDNINNLIQYLNQKQQAQQPQASAQPQQPQQTQYGNKNLVEFNGGGTHQQNPLGGIPQGSKSVEAEETAFKLPQGKFIFSNRIALDGKKQEVSSDYNNLFQSAYGGYITRKK